MAIQIPGGTRLEIPIFKAGATSEDDPSRAWTDADVAKLIRFTQKALKARALSIPLIIGHTNPENLNERPAMGWVSGIRRGTLERVDADTGKKFKILAVFADVVMNSELHNHYTEKRYFEVSVEIHADYVIPTARGKKPKKFPYVIGAVAFLGESAPAHNMMFCHDVDHEGNAFMYQKKSPKEVIMPSDNFAAADLAVDLRAAIDMLSGIADQLEAGDGEEEEIVEETAEEQVEQNAADSETQEDAPDGDLATTLSDIRTALKVLQGDYDKKEQESKADAEYAKHGNGVTREMWDPIALKHGATKAAEMFSATPVGPPKGRIPSSKQGTTETAALTAEMNNLREGFGGFYSQKSDDALKVIAQRNLNSAANAAGSN